VGPPSPAAKQIKEMNYSAFVMPIDDDEFGLVIMLEGFTNQPDAHQFIGVNNGVVWLIR
jgi:hypothetical protein